MFYFNKPRYLDPTGPHRDKRSFLLFTGAILLATLTLVIAAVAGEAPALLTFVLLLVMFASIGNYKAGILTAVILLPLTATQEIPREMFGIKGLNPLNGALALSIVSLLLARAIQHRSILIPRWPRHFWWYIGVITFAALYGALYTSTIPSYYLLLRIIDFNSSSGYLRDVLFKPAVILLTAYMLSVAVANAKRPDRYLIPLFASMMTLPIMVIGYVLLSGVSLTTLASSEHRSFLSALGIHANELGYLFNMAFALVLFCFFSIRNRLVKWLLALMMATLLVAIMLTFSRGAFLGVITVVGYILFTQRKFRTALTIMLLVGTSTFLMPDAVMQRASTGAQSGNLEGMSAGRVDRIWEPLLPEVIGSPLIGHGLSSILWSDAAIHRAILPVGHPHSAYLGALLDFGVLGSIVIFIFFQHMWRLFARIAKFHPDPLWRAFFQGGVACILVMLVQGLTDDRFTPTLPQTFLWLTYGIAIGLATRANRIARHRARLNHARDNLQPQLSVTS